MKFLPLTRAALLSVLTIAGAAPAIAQGRDYGPRDARYVTQSRNPDVIDYVLCLEYEVNNQPRRFDAETALDNAIVSCRNEEYQATNSGGRRDVAEVQQSILDCGFRPSDATPGMGCGPRPQRGNDGPQDPRGGNGNPGNGAGAAGIPRMDTNGFPVDAVSLGGKVRVGPSTSDPQASSTLSGQTIRLLGNAGSPYQGFPWFALRLNDGQIAYQWGGSICMSRSPINGVKGYCAPQSAGNAPLPNGGGSAGNGGNSGNGTADVVIGILDLFAQLSRDKNGNSAPPIVEQRLNVAPGSTANAQGSLNRGQLAIHSITGRKGQTLRVDLTSTSNDAAFEIFVGQIRPGGTTLRGAGPEQRATRFVGVLPADGTYKIAVAPGRNATSYRMAVSLSDAPRPGNGQPGQAYDTRNDKFVGTYESQTAPAGTIERRGNTLVWSDRRGRSFPLTVDWANRKLLTRESRQSSFDVDFKSGRVTGFSYGRDYYTRASGRNPQRPAPEPGNAQPTRPQPGENASAASCKRRTQVVSTSVRTGAKVSFNNRRNSEVRIFWIGYDGKEGDYGGTSKPLLTLLPNQQLDVDSRVGFAFVALDRRGDCVGLFKTSGLESSYTFDR